MVKKREPNDAELQDQKAVSRRDFVKVGAAAGLGAAVLSSPGKAQAQTSPADIQWDYEADVIVCGSGATGLPAAKRAHDLGADVLVIEQNFDIGGKLSHNGGFSSFGGGDAVQERDRLGLPDPDGWLTAPLTAAGGCYRRPRHVVPRHDRLVGRRRRPGCRLSLQLARIPAGVGRQRGRDPPVPDGQPRSLRAHFGTHSGGGMTKSRAASFDHEARRQDGHRGGDDHHRRLRQPARRKDNHPSTPKPAVPPARRPTAYGAPGCVSRRLRHLALP